MSVHSFFSFAFILGRESLLSCAEIEAVMPREASVIAKSASILIIGNISQEQAIYAFEKLGWSTRLVGIFGEIATPQDWSRGVSVRIEERSETSKLTFAVASFGLDLPLSKIGITIKKRSEKSLRLANTTDKNLNGASFLVNKLEKTESEYSLLQCGKTLYEGITLRCQDVDSWAKRDMERTRDAKVGMLPTKLARSMLNLAGDFSTVWDPFVGLGTVLTEARALGIQALIWSDSEERMIELSSRNLGEWVSLFRLDARDIDTKSSLLRDEHLAIVTEGYLGTPMHEGNLSARNIERERTVVRELYEGFLTNLKRGGFAGTIIICVPLWHFNSERIEVGVDVLARRNGWKISPLLSKNFAHDDIPRNTLIYRREGQIVGREIVRLILA